MYKMTPRMLQHFEQSLREYHNLFSGGRCQGWELEELIVKAIKSDTGAQHQVFWREAGHDDKEDLLVRTNGNTYPIQIKSGQWQRQSAMLSGHRLGRFKGDFEKITAYLNARAANIISVPYEKIDGQFGRKHVYQVCYISIESLRNVDPENWKKKRTAYEQKNAAGVLFSLRPSMSWQIWWKIPRSLIESEDKFSIT